LFTKVIADYFSKFVIENFENLVKDVIAAYNDDLSKSVMYINEFTSSENKWKVIVDNNKKILSDKQKEKETLLSSRSELERRIDTITRDLKEKENEFKQALNLKNIELNNTKALNDNQLHERNLVSDSLSKQIEDLSLTIAKVNDQTIALQKEKLKEVSNYKKQQQNLKDSIDQMKKQLDTNSEYVALNTLFKKIKSNFEEFKQAITDNDDMKKTKAKIYELQKELNEKRYKKDTNVLNCKKQINDNFKMQNIKHRSQITEIQTEIDNLKRQNEEYLDKIRTIENNVDLVSSKIDVYKRENAVLEDSLKINSSLAEVERDMLENLEEKFNQVKKKNNELELKVYEVSIKKAEKNIEKEAVLNFLFEIVRKFASGKKDKKGNDAELFHRLGEDDKVSISEILKPLHIDYSKK